MRFLIIALLMLVGCAKPNPINEVRAAIEAGDMERAQEILEPYAATAAPEEAPTWEPRVLVRWTHPEPERIERMQIAVKPQGYTWFSSVREYEVDETDGIHTTALRGSWLGCAEVRAEVFNGMNADGTRVRSGISNTIVAGECLDPPPILVPEPEGGWRVLGILLCCITLAWIYHSRGKS